MIQVAALRRRCDPARLPFGTTAEFREDAALIGQERAVTAARFGVDVPGDGYNSSRSDRPTPASPPRCARCSRRLRSDVRLFDGTAEGRRALSFAENAARGPGAEVVVLLAARHEAARERLRRDVAAHLDRAVQAAELREMEHASAEAVARSAAGSALVLSRTRHERVTRLLRRIEGPVIVVG